MAKANVSNRMLILAMCAMCAVGAVNAADRTVSADYVLASDETVDGVLSVNPGVTVDLAGHKLTVKGLAGGGTITSSQPLALNGSASAPSFLADEATFWLDAADDSTLTLDGAKVTAWSSKTGNLVAKPASDENAPSYDSSTYGMPTVDFGATGSGKDLKYSNMDNIKTVFWVVKIEENPNAFLLGGSSYHFHRGEVNAAYAATTHFKYDTMWNGVDEIVPFIDIPSSGRFHVIAARMNMPCSSNSLTQDRGLPERTGGRQLSELICFSRDLSEEERMAVTRYLQDKWGVTDGELHIDVDENDNSVNDSVAIEGSLKVVKKGRGTFTASKENQSYTGGTVIDDGTVVLGTSNHPLGRGDKTRLVTVNAGTKLDINNKADTAACSYNYNLAGTLNIRGDSDGWAWGSGHEPFGLYVNLSGDSYFTGDNFILGAVDNAHTLSFRMNGNRLHYDAGYSYAKNVVMKGPGTIVYRSGHMEASEGFESRSVGMEFTGSSYAHLGNQGFSVGDFRYDVEKWTTHRSADQVIVYGRYVAGRVRPWMTLQSGATLDLSECPGTFALEGADPVSGGANRWPGPGTVNLLSANAKYTVDLGARTDLTPGMRVVSWPSSYLPDVDTVDFEVVTTGAGQTLAERNLTVKIKTGEDGGIYIRSTLVPYAKWIVDDATPENSGWRFFNPQTGVEDMDWEEGVTEDVEVRFSSYSEWTAIRSANVSPLRYLMTGNVVLDSLEGMWSFNDAFDIAEGTVIDLKGRKISLMHFGGLAAVEDSSSDVDNPGELILVASSDMINLATSFSGNMRVVKEGPGTFTASVPNQSYTGGTAINEGTVVLGTSTHPLGVGDGTRSVTIGLGAGLDINNKADTNTCLYDYRIAGTLRITGENGWCWEENKRIFSGLELMGDAHLTGWQFYLGSGSADNPLRLVMNGHTLHIEPNGEFFVKSLTTVGNGKILVSSGENQFDSNIDMSSVDVEFTSGTFAHLGNAAFSTRDFRYGSNRWKTNRTASQVTVFGRYFAGAMRPWLTMQDGSTLDLSGLSGTWNSDGEVPCGGGAHREFRSAGRVSFASGAAVAVDLGGRDVQELKELAKSELPYLLTWDAESDAAFTLDSTSCENGFRIKKDGTGLRLYLSCGFLLIVK